MGNLPYITSPGNIDKALSGMMAAAVPEKVSQDFVKTILKIPGGSGDQITSFIKKLGLANADGSPNDEYRKFRNPTSSGSAIAKAIRRAYKPLFMRNEFAHELNDEELIGLIIEETGQAHDSNPVRMALSTFKHLKTFASFTDDEPVNETETSFSPSIVNSSPNSSGIVKPSASEIGLNLSYTINLNLPATSDPAVFDAIFKSLKSNLLNDQDA